MPGVLETIPSLSQNNQLGLVTGNIEVMARKKLKKFSTDEKSLNDYFQFGGFGNDIHEKRSDLIILAIKRAKNNHGWKKNNSVYVVDDTFRGIGAAIEASERIKTKIITIGITTGIYSKEQLKEAGADIIVDNFNEIPELIR